MTDANQIVHVPKEAASWPIAPEWSRLDALCDGVFDCPHTTPPLTHAGPFVVRSQDIRSGVFRLDQAGHVSEETYRERIDRAEPRYGDLLFSREGTYFGIAAEVPPETRVCLGQRMVLIRPKRAQLSSRFLRYWLNSPLMVAYIANFKDGSVAERLNMPTIRGLPVPRIPFSRQTQIADLLGALDDKIDLNRRQSVTLETMARAIFKDWFVDFGPTRAQMEGRPPYLAPDIWALFPDRLDSGDKPEGWNMTRLGQHAVVTNGRSYTSSELAPSKTALVTLKSFARGGGYRRDGLKPYTGAFKKSQILNDGDIVIAQTDVTQAADIIGRPARVIADQRFSTLVASLDVAILRPAANGVLDKQFLLGITRDDTFTQHAIAHSTGTTVLHLSKEAIPNFEFPMPEISLVQRHFSLAGPLIDRVAASVRESDALIATRDFLIPKLISGEIRVGDAEKIAEAAA